MALHLHKWGFEDPNNLAAGLAAERFINEQIPERLHGSFAAEHSRIGARDGLHAANRWLLGEARAFDQKRDEARFLNWLDDFGNTLGRSGIVDADLRLLADCAVQVAKPFVQEEHPDNIAEFADLVESETGIQVVGQHEAARGARLACDRFWRRKVRVTHGRALEEQKRASGVVTRTRQLYVSDEAIELHRAQRKRNKSLLENIIASNDEGMECTLQELSDKGVSNPELRRNELMTRIRGFEEYAKVNAHCGLFFTITAPSKYHATTKTGRKNSKWNGATPRDAQKYLSKVWAKVRAKWKRAGIAPYGFRIAEPHQDGTPHWHLLLFVEQASEATAVKVFRDYAIEEDRAELTKPGKKEDVTPRFTVVTIDWNKGSAAGYIAKYVCKNIDGKRSDGSFVEGDSDEAQGVSISDSAVRVSAWASTWGIRQFQQIGKASVTLWRELRRVASNDGGIEVKRKTTNQIKTLAGIADSGEWAKFFQDVGGKEGQKVSLYQVEATEPNRYGETGQKVIKGVQAHHYDGVVEVTITRFRTWVFELKRGGADGKAGLCGQGYYKGNGFEKSAMEEELRGLSGFQVRQEDGLGCLGLSGAAATWTGVNNCTGVKGGREVKKPESEAGRGKNSNNIFKGGGGRAGFTGSRQPPGRFSARSRAH